MLGQRLDEGLAAELREAVAGLGGRVIVRSSSPLEGDPRWSGAFSSVAEVGPGDVGTAVRSCWASAFAVDPLARLAACGLPPEALELGVLLQPEIRPVAGGVARVTPAAHAAGAEVTVEGVLGHPGALLSGWAEGASAIVRLPVAPHDAAPLPGQLTRRGQPARPGQPGRSGRPDQGGDGRLAALIGTATVAAVADLAGRVWQRLGDDVIEWAADDGGIWLLQSRRSGAMAHEAGGGTAGRGGARQVGRAEPVAGTEPGGGGRSRWPGRSRVAGTGRGAAAGLPTSRASMPLLAATVLRRGEHVPGRPGAPGTAAGRLVAVKPHERPARRLRGCHPAGRPAGAGPGAAAVRRPRRHRPDRGGGLASGRGRPQPRRADGARLPPGAGDRRPGRPRRRLPRRHRRLDRRRGAAPRDGGLAGGRGGIRISALSGLHHPASTRPVPGPSGQRI